MPFTSALPRRGVHDSDTERPTGGKTPHNGPKNAADGDCFHCGLPVPGGVDLRVTIDEIAQPMCCPGCQAVATAIVAAGQEQFYRVRTETAPTGAELVPEFLRQTEVFDAPAVQRQFVRESAPGRAETSLMLEGISCAACVWLIEQYLSRLPGIESVDVNYATQRAWVQWDSDQIRLSEILQAVRRIGYRAQPYDPHQHQATRERERRLQLRRLAVAGLFGMQVMMLSISLYAGAWSGMEARFTQVFRWLCLALTIPVIAFAALPFFNAAWRELSRGRVGMDLPVSLAIAIAFAASTWATLGGSGEIYFDSVVMFVFFLSASRYLENMARQRCAARVEQLAQTTPVMATRLGDDDEAQEPVPASLLEVGDRLLVRPGESVPADGEIISGFSAFDESLLTGESHAVPKQAGDAVTGGSINVDNPLQMRVTAVGVDTVLAEIRRMIDRAQADKPPLARLADRVAARFILAVLAAVVTVGGYWWLRGDARWFEIALSVLIVSCPCALSLATPTAISATLGRLQSLGLLIRRAGALEQFTRVTHVVFDKTGTLTRGQPRLQRILCNTEAAPADCLAIAVGLERNSEHPLARALVAAAGHCRSLEVDNLVSVAGGGIRGDVDGHGYSLGSPDFILRETGLELPQAWREHLLQDSGTAVVLANAERPMALFTFDDSLRPEALDVVASLKEQDKRVILMTGDRHAAAQMIARAAGIDDVRAGLTPDQKMKAVRELQAAGARVLMVGDGVNDAPVLASADVAIAMAEASSLAKTSADVVLIADRLDEIGELFSRAARNQRIIRQNMCWALTYNFGAIPAAAAGLVAPWLAAIGMSLSSLVVVLNAMRLSR